ncbi:MAG: T9SS type A sorting domain-containing protein, partial [Ignavibacteriaceae bacterium]
FTDSSNGWAGGEYWEQDYLEPQTLLSYTTNGGIYWESINGGSGGFGGNRINDVFFLDKNYGLLTTQYVGGYGYIYKTLDGGKFWNDITPDSLINNSNKEYFYSNASFLSIQFINKEFGWVVGYAETFGLGIGGFIFKTEDGGITWRDQTENHLLGYLDVEFNDFFNGWILGNSTYNDSNIISQYKMGSMPNIAELKFKNDLHVSIRTKNINHKIIKSEDKFFFSEYLKNIDLNTPNISNHLLNTTDGGQSWNITNFDSVINAITFIDRYDGWAIGNNSTIYKYTLNTFIPFTKTLSVKEFTLYQNYPNPFNPSTTIKYALPYESSVDVTIYNMIGQRIEDFNEGIKEAGYHDVTWQPKNLSSGVYFYSINARSIDGNNDYSKTLKMLYIK